MSITTYQIAETALVKLTFFSRGGMRGIAATGLGVVPFWAIAPFAACWAWGVVECLAGRPMTSSGEEVKRP